MILEGRRRPSLALAAVLALTAMYACRIEREHGAGDGVHPEGYADVDSLDFHGHALQANGFPLAECRECHGDDYAGGRVGSSCLSAGCHTEGVESCGTCHEASPSTESHLGHVSLSCDSCHPSHTDARSSNHPDGAVDLSFGSLASAQAFAPSYDPSSKTCASVYCHGGIEQTWGGDGPLGCAGCHEAPPPWHAQFAEKLPSTPGLALVETACISCHPAIEKHLNGQVDATPLACNACHGKGPLGAPPPGLLVSASPAAIGAHARHLDPTLGDRIGRVAACNDCHLVPDAVSAAGHIDAEAPADVRLRQNEEYMVASRSCDVGCHWNIDPGPRWDDADGSARACDACHAFPPDKTRTGTAHPPTAPDLAVCRSCHTFDPSTHVDGKVDFVW